MKKFSQWSKAARMASIGAAGVIVVAAFATAGVVAFNTVVAPKITADRATQCEQHFTTDSARELCEQGAAGKAKTTEKKELAALKVRSDCAAKYDDTVAQGQCIDGDVSAADAAQKSADEAAAAAEKLASRGESFDNPFPAGTKVPMQSTNRLDGSQVDFVEWVTDFTADWRGYDEYSAPEPGHKYIAYMVHLKATDAGVDAGMGAYDASFTDSKGNVYEQDTITYEAKPKMPDVTLGANQQAKGMVVFQVPTSVSSGVATFGSGTVFVSLK